MLAFLAVVLMTMASVSYAASITSITYDFKEGVGKRWDTISGDVPDDKSLTVFVVPGFSAMGLHKMPEKQQVGLAEERGRAVETDLRKKGFSRIIVLPGMEIGSMAVGIFCPTLDTLSLSEIVSLATQVASDADRAEGAAKEAEESARQAKESARQAKESARQAEKSARWTDLEEESEAFVYPLGLSELREAINIKIVDNKLFIHDSLVPQNRSPLVKTNDENGWGNKPRKRDYFRKTKDWWHIDATYLPVISSRKIPSGARFNAKRGDEWINPNQANPSPEIRIHQNSDGSLCFVRVKE